VKSGTPWKQLVNSDNSCSSYSVHSTLFNNSTLYLICQSVSLTLT